MSDCVQVQLGMENITARLKSRNIDFVELPETDFNKIRDMWIKKFTKG